MDEYLSPSGNRAVALARTVAAQRATPQVAPLDLLLGIIGQDESRGAVLLGQFGVTAELLRGVRDNQPGTPAIAATQVGNPPLGELVRQVLARVRGRAKERGADSPPGTDVLLGELLAIDTELQSQLIALGIDVAGLLRQLDTELGRAHQPLEAEFDRLDIADPADTVNTYRVLDAAANRAREGLRVLEDHARFARDDPFLAAELKTARHDLKLALDRLPRLDLLRARDTLHDVGTTIHTAAEWSRRHPADVVAANFKRAQEAIRSLEEFGKLECPALAEPLQALRYRLYTIERLHRGASDGAARVAAVTLYVLATREGCAGDLEWTVREALAGGAQAIQLREKTMPDGELVALARRVRRWTADAGALFIMNDRPDLARLAEADGVHVGQDELPVLDARRIVGSRALIGVSTHNIEQARRAVRDGADYIGVGPTFPSTTKSFDSFPGIGLVREVSAELCVPAFVIGGVTLERLDEIVAAGGRRVAVSAAICTADDPRRAAAEFRSRLQSIATRESTTATADAARPEPESATHPGAARKTP